MSSPPNLDKANDGDFAGVMTDVLQNFLRGVDDMIPAKVVSYDDATNRDLNWLAYKMV